MATALAPRVRAAAGARLMDQYKPQWYLAVDPDRLDIDDIELCVIAQVDGCWCCSPLVPFALSIAALDQWAAEYGFASQSTPGEEDDHEDLGDKTELEQAWRHEITMRRTLAPVAHALLAEAAA